MNDPAPTDALRDLPEKWRKRSGAYGHAGYTGVYSEGRSDAQKECAAELEAALQAGKPGEAVGDVLWYDGHRYARLFDEENCPLPEGTKLYAEAPQSDAGARIAELQAELRAILAVAELQKTPRWNVVADAARRALAAPPAESKESA
jgi:hypothetical protein